MRQRRSVLAILASLLSTTLLVSACGGSKSSGSGDGLEKKNITVASLPLVDAAGLHIAVAHKFFEQEGLHVTIKPVAQSILALPALKNGQVDVIAGANYTTFLQAHASGALKLRIVADGASEAPRFMAAWCCRTPPSSSPRTLRARPSRSISSTTSSH
jgi:NitT/TauT family transport system substrate-binding protein